MLLKTSVFLSVLFLISWSLFMAPCNAYNQEDDTGSLLLTEADFGGAIKENEYVLVNFHALWCKYSKKLRPAWKELADSIKNGVGYGVTLAKVEAYDEKKLAEQYGIEGYPTIKLFIKEQPHDYNGERTQFHILEFVDRKTKRTLKNVDTVSQVEDYLKEYEWVGILPGTNNDNQNTAKDVAFNIGDVLFLTTTSSDVKSKYSVEDGQFVLVSSVPGGVNVNKDALTVDTLTKFINDNKFSSIAPFTKGTAEHVFLSDEPSLILIKKNDQAGTDAENAFKDANKNIGSKVFMSVANSEDEIGKLLLESLGINESELPTVRIIKAEKERIKKYYLDGQVTSSSIEAFYNDYTNQKAKRFYLSESVPAENNDLVIKVVTNSFKDIVLDQNNDVLLHIWAPWCGHCRAMAPVYDNVARKTSEVSDFVVAKIDASANDLEGFGLDIVEYPTILLFKKNDKLNPIEFTEERNEYKFDEFIRANAAVDLAKMKGPNPFDKNEL